MSINIWTDSMQHAALLGKPVLFTNWLIQRDIIPDGWYCYDLRGTHKSPSTRTTLVDHAADYHAGTVLSPIPLKHEGTASRRVNGTFYLLGEEMTLEQFCEEHDLAYPQDNREFVLRPASLDEVGLFYSEEKLDEALGTVGHLRMDFGHGEKEFWHTWWPHNEDRFNTPEFKEVLQRFVDDLRQTGLLKNLGAMDAYLPLSRLTVRGPQTWGSCALGCKFPRQCILCAGHRSRHPRLWRRPQRIKAGSIPNGAETVGLQADQFRPGQHDRKAGALQGAAQRGKPRMAKESLCPTR